MEDQRSRRRAGTTNQAELIRLDQLSAFEKEDSKIK